VWGAYGKVCKAWILFSAWVGTRPGETFSLTWDDLDLEQGLVSVKRCKPPYNVDVIPVAQRVREALLEMPGERTGHLFTTVRGLPIRKGAYTWYWDRVRAVFEAKLEPARRAELLGDRLNLDLYELRHAARRRSWRGRERVRRRGAAWQLAAGGPRDVHP
jgi:integrase